MGEDLLTPCNLVVGQRVVFFGKGSYPTFETAYSAAGLIFCAPKRGHIYTVRTISAEESGVVGIRLQEIINAHLPPPYPTEECQFWHGEYVPVVENKTDISIFKKMLTPKKEKSNVC